MLAGDVVFDSQTKVRLRSISKVKQDDFKDVVKDIEKIFKKNPDSWDPYAEKLNELAESMKGLTASMRAQKMIDSSSSGVGAYRMKKDFVKGFVDATAGLKDRWDCELFIVEGNSAGQALVSGRPDTKYFAVLPLRGKILNVTTKTSDQALDSQTIYSIYNCIGLGIDENNVLKDSKTAAEAMMILKQRSRYGKIIICSDNDPDGSIIANELLHLFGKFSRFLLETGMIYRALGPLFRGKSKTTGKDTYYFPDDKADPSTGFPVDLDLKSHISYYKGLGSLTPESGEIEEVFFDKSKRRLIQITPDGLDYMMKLNEDIDERKKLLFNNGILSNPYNFTDL
jgi:DNA gyrase/topoisomerase IV subunit B